MAKKQLYKGRPDFPNEEAKCIPASGSSNDTDEIYCIDTGGNACAFQAGMQSIADNGTKSTSEWAGKTFNGVLYGRWTNVGGDCQLACYFVDPANSEA